MKRINTHNVMLAAIVMFCMLFLIMLVGMIIPLFTGAVLDARWFNDRTALPSLLLTMLLGICLLLLNIAPSRIAVMVIAVVIATVLSIIASPFGNLPIDASMPILIFAMLAIFYRSYTVLSRSQTFQTKLRSISPHIIHLGIILILIGVFVSTNTRIDGSAIIQKDVPGTFEGQPYAVKITGITNQYEGTSYEGYPGSSYVTRIDFELYLNGRLIDRDEVKYITDFKWGQSYATNYVYRSLTKEVFITTKMVEGDLVNMYMRTAPWITAVWGGIILMSIGIVLRMVIPGRTRTAPEKDIDKSVDEKYERLLREELG